MMMPALQAFFFCFFLDVIDIIYWWFFVFLLSWGIWIQGGLCWTHLTGLYMRPYVILECLCDHSLLLFFLFYRNRREMKSLLHPPWWTKQRSPMHQSCFFLFNQFFFFLFYQGSPLVAYRLADKYVLFVMFGLTGLLGMLVCDLASSANLR